jgi:hypothetical protein
MCMRLCLSNVQGSIKVGSRAEMGVLSGRWRGAAALTWNKSRTVTESSVHYHEREGLLGG